jgi:hypothetical protein
MKKIISSANIALFSSLCQAPTKKKAKYPVISCKKITPPGITAFCRRMLFGN